MSDVAPVLCTIERRVATVTFNRPDKRNAWTPALQHSFDAILSDLTADDDVRAVVLTGAGSGFCAGADMEVLSNLDPDANMGDSRELLSQMWFPKPIVAAINGACAGLGLQLALMCDVRFASSTAKLTTAFSRRGLIAEHGLSWLLPKLTSLAVASELLISGRVFSGDEAAALGVVHKALPAEDLMAAATAYARDLADNVSPTSMAVIKWQMYHHADFGLMASIVDSDKLMTESARRRDVAEGVASFVQRRAPQFPPLDRAAVPPATGHSPGAAGNRQL